MRRFHRRRRHGVAVPADPATASAPVTATDAAAGDVRQRVQAFLARAGVASRRASERLVASGRVAVNGQVVTAPGSMVTSGDQVTVDGRLVDAARMPISLALHKPSGYLCSNADPRGRRLARELLPEADGHLFHVGRLDLASSGLILFTNDGQLAMRATHPTFGVEKEYEVTSDRRVPRVMLERYRAGCRIKGITYTLAGYRQCSAHRVRLILTEGRNREIRRVFRHFGVPVRNLVRLRVGPVALTGLAPGRWRALTADEVAWFLGRVRREPARPADAVRR